LNSPVDANDVKAGSPREVAEVPETEGEQVDPNSSKEKASVLEDIVEGWSSGADETKKEQRRPKRDLRNVMEATSHIPQQVKGRCGGLRKT